MRISDWSSYVCSSDLPGQSRSRDEQAFLTENANRLIVGSAINSKKYAGYVECHAQKGGDRRLEHQKFLVPSAEYKTRKFGFVIDETRHVPFGPNTLPHAIHMILENINTQPEHIETLTHTSTQTDKQNNP